MTTVSWYAELALRIRVSMSAIGSVMVMVRRASSRRGSRAGPVGEASLSLSRGPRGGSASPWWCYQLDLVTPGSSPRVRHLPDADPAQAEHTVDRARPAAPLAAGVAADRELRLAVALTTSAFFAICLSALASLTGSMAVTDAASVRKGTRAAAAARALLVGAGGGDHGDVHPALPVHPVHVDLVEHRLLGETERVVAVAVELRSATARGSPGCAAARCDSSRSRNSHIRSPRRVTFAPIGMPSRSLNCAIDLRARCTSGFWPVIAVRSRTAPSISFASRAASPTPMLTTTLTTPGTCMTLS